MYNTGNPMKPQPEWDEWETGVARSARAVQGFPLTMLLGAAVCGMEQGRPRSQENTVAPKQGMK